MEWLIKFSNLVTVGNLSTFAGIIMALVYFYYRIRKYIAQQHAEYMAYISTLTANQTAHIEACIHKLPDHPESPENKSGSM